MSILNSFPFRHRDFGLFWAGIFLVNVAVQIEAVTIGWQIYGIGRQSMSIGESAFLVGMVGLAQFVPLFVLTLWAGSLADRHSRRAIVLVSLLVETLCVLGLVAVALEDAPQVTHIFAIAAMFGAARAFLSPASSALVPMLVPKSDMPQAISLKSLAWQTAVIIWRESVEALLVIGILHAWLAHEAGDLIERVLDQLPIGIVLGQYPLQVLFYAIQFNGGQKLPIGQTGHPIAIATNACKFFNIAIPWRKIIISNRPVDRESIPSRTSKIKIAPTLGMTTP